MGRSLPTATGVRVVPPKQGGGPAKKPKGAPAPTPTGGFAAPGYLAGGAAPGTGAVPGSRTNLFAHVGEATADNVETTVAVDMAVAPKQGDAAGEDDEGGAAMDQAVGEGTLTDAEAEARKSAWLEKEFGADLDKELAEMGGADNAGTGGARGGVDAAPAARPAAEEEQGAMPMQTS
jgi:hypothetical protein